MNYYPIGWHISLLYRAQQTFLTNETKDFDIGGGQVPYVFNLFANPGASQDEVARMLDLDKTSVTRAVLKMEKSGIIERKRDQDDHRVIRLHLTEKGLLVHKQLKNVLQEWFDILFEDMSQEDIHESKRLMEILSKNAKNYKKECLDDKD